MCVCMMTYFCLFICTGCHVFSCFNCDGSFIFVHVLIFLSFFALFFLIFPFSLLTFAWQLTFPVCCCLIVASIQRIVIFAFMLSFLHCVKSTFCYCRCYCFCCCPCELYARIFLSLFLCFVLIIVVFLFLFLFVSLVSACDFFISLSVYCNTTVLSALLIKKRQNK